jgi:hypothetical protein
VRILQVRALAWQGDLLGRLGQPDPARRILNQASEVLGETIPPWLEARIWALLGRVELGVGRFEASQTLTEAALNLNREIRDLRGEAENGCSWARSA